MRDSAFPNPQFLFPARRASIMTSKRRGFRYAPELIAARTFRVGAAMELGQERLHGADERKLHQVQSEFRWVGAVGTTRTRRPGHDATRGLTSRRRTSDVGCIGISSALWKSMRGSSSDDRGCGSCCPICRSGSSAASFREPTGSVSVRTCAIAFLESVTAGPGSTGRPAPRWSTRRSPRCATTSRAAPTPTAVEGSPRAWRRARWLPMPEQPSRRCSARTRAASCSVPT